MAQLEAVSLCPIICHLKKETNSHLTTTFIQVVVESDEDSAQPPFPKTK